MNTIETLKHGIGSLSMDTYRFLIWLFRRLFINVKLRNGPLRTKNWKSLKIFKTLNKNMNEKIPRQLFHRLLESVFSLMGPFATFF